MNLAKKIILSCLVFLLAACANYKIDKSKQVEEKIFFSSKGFAMIYNDDLYEQGAIDKKMYNEDIIVMHSSLKKGTHIKIINPAGPKVIKTKIYGVAKYPKIFNVVLSKKAATTLNLDVDNPYVELFELKQNKTFIANETTIFDEEKNVADTVPVDEVKMDDLSEKQTETKKKLKISINFGLIISDFYFYDSAKNLGHELTKKTQNNKFFVKKINDKKYRLSVGPFKNFNALKSIYISLNNLGFDDLNIYREQQ